MNTTVLNTKISKVENKIQDTINLVATNFLNTKINYIENKSPDHAKYITTQEFNKLTARSFARLTQASLVRKANCGNKLIIFNRKISSNKTKYLGVLKKLNSLITKDYNLFLCRMY